MANALYDGGREGILDDSIAVSTATIKALLVTSGYTPNLATHRNVSDVTSGNIVARSGALASKTYTAGVFNAANVTLTAVTGSAVNYIVIYADSGTDSTSRLIALIDTATGLPVTPNGGDITITWDTGTNKIFKL
ncbi:MAG: hypothetical protein ACJ780_09950 [Solirubrobacteraceae bacterium]|jgi:hypothetical protein